MSDKKIGIDNNSDGMIDYYMADVVSASDYYPFGMQMPGRNFSAGSYRYGFNGKENDNDVKGDGNQQDYGMRVYDPRLGRFLSNDPLSKEYNDLSPYHYAGNNPIQNLDRDGGEPLDYQENWKPRRFNTNGGAFAYSSNVKDPQLGYIDVEAVYDNWSKRTWFIHQGNDGVSYYWKHNPGEDQTIRMAGNGKWASFKTQNTIRAEQNGRIATAMAASFAALMTAPFMYAAGAGAWGAVEASAVNIAVRGLLAYYRYAPAIGSLGRLAAEFLDETGTTSSANAGTPFFTSGVLAKTGNWLYGKLAFTGTSGEKRLLEAGGELIADGTTLTINTAAYIEGLDAKQSKGELSREGLNALLDQYKKFANEEGYKKVIINYERSEGSSSKNPGSTQQFIFDL